MDNMRADVTKDFFSARTMASEAQANYACDALNALNTGKYRPYSFAVIKYAGLYAIAKYCDQMTYSKYYRDDCSIFKPHPYIFVSIGENEPKKHFLGFMRGRHDYFYEEVSHWQAQVTGIPVQVIEERETEETWEWSDDWRED